MLCIPWYFLEDLLLVLFFTTLISTIFCLLQGELSNIPFEKLILPWKDFVTLHARSSPFLFLESRSTEFDKIITSIWILLLALDYS